MPIGGADHQTLQVVRKSGGAATSWSLCECRFVPLVSESRE
jgi:hypothetical protein